MADQDFNIKVVTTADTSGLRQTSDEMRKIREQQEKIRQDEGAAKLFARIPPGGPPPKPPPGPKEPGEELGEHIGRGFERVAIHAVGVGAILQALEAIKATAVEINKITESLDKQGELLVENARHLITQAKYSKDESDVLKIAEQGMKNIAEQHKIVEELQKKELTTAQAIADNLTHGPTFGVRPNQALLDEERAQASRNEMAARQTTLAAIRTAEIEKERQATQSLAQTEAELNAKLAEQEKLRASAWINLDIKGYVEAGQAVQEYKKQIADIGKQKDQAQKSVDQAALKSDAQVQHILANEQAAAAAKAAGNEKDAEMFQRSADLYKAGATPKQLQDLQKIHDAQDKISKVEPPKYEPLSPEEFQRQNEAAEKELQKGGGLTGGAAAAARKAEIDQTAEESLKAEEERKAEIEKTRQAGVQAEQDRYQQLQKEKEKQGLTSMEDPNSTILSGISSKLDQLLGLWR